MALDYSKWDALELSDDSDFEPHPNVDKRSFIRAKQNQIHMQREHRKNQIETLKYERIINDGLLRRIDTLIAELRRQESDVQDRAKVLFQALMASAGDPDEDEPPTPPAGVHSKDEPIRYSQMMASLIDQVQKEVDESKTDNWLQGYTKALEEHKEKVTGLQKNLLTKLAELEKEESRKITSDKIHDGFNVSSVSKEKDTKAGGKSATKAKTVELLNPASLEAAQPASSDGAQSSGADADVDEVGGALGEEDEDHIQASKHGKEFAKIKMGDYQRDLRFISEHHEILTERETDALLIMAFDAQLKGRVELAKQYIHQGLLLQYCRSLGPDGVRLFFKR
jgi:cell division cycle protein 37